MKELPENVVAYKRTPNFTEDTVPAGLLKDHTTAVGTWGLIQVENGTLEYIIGDDEAYTLSPDTNGVVEPTVVHHVRAVGPVSFFVEFYR
jgi:tellurite resistance-related uncharacterized protein